MINKEVIIFQIEDMLSNVNKENLLLNGGRIDDGKTFLELMTNVLALLKEQEAVEPILKREGRNKNYNDYVCPRCDNVVVYEQNYCSECGVEFTWEGR